MTRSSISVVLGEYDMNRGGRKGRGGKVEECFGLVIAAQSSTRQSGHDVCREVSTLNFDIDRIVEYDPACSYGPQFILLDTVLLPSYTCAEHTAS